jgi:hypothetical protein
LNPLIENSFKQHTGSSSLPVGSGNAAVIDSTTITTFNYCKIGVFMTTEATSNNNNVTVSYYILIKNSGGTTLSTSRTVSGIMLTSGDTLNSTIIHRTSSALQPGTYTVELYGYTDISSADDIHTDIMVLGNLA